ncbi:4-alpha-glucanotransferase [soil metagenome]
MHVSSLPSPHGIGTIGNEARQLATILAEAGQRYWQMLPVGPTGYRDSPYQSPSTFAGNPLLIDLPDLVERGLLAAREIKPLTELPKNQVAFGPLIKQKSKLLSKAASRQEVDRGLASFLKTPWLENYAAYTALKEANDLRSWTDWPGALALRQQPELSRAIAKVRRRMELEVGIQYLFHQQWESLRAHCRKLGVVLIGDVPIFVAHDSADVWSQPDLFELDDRGNPTVVAGVPPDYFSKTGQRWGNPLYRWDLLRADGYKWWNERMTASLSRFDLVRVDHFRGFCAYWEIPATEVTAVKGRWVPGPGVGLFQELAGQSQLPIIAEDLGVITPDVTALRQRFGFPGMRVGQFGFDDEPETALHNPDNFPPDVVAYTGTHDNDTTVGWFWGNNRRHDRRRLTRHRRRLLERVGTRGEEINWDLIELVMASKAETAIVPVQDLLGLGSEARMNTPGKEEGNWVWRMDGPLPDHVLTRLRETTAASDRHQTSDIRHQTDPRSDLKSDV